MGYTRVVCYKLMCSYTYFVYLVYALYDVLQLNFMGLLTL